MYITRERERKEISKEEFDKRIYHRKDDSIEELCKEMFHNSDYIKEPVLKFGIGILGILDPNNIIGYRYYRLGKEKLVYICGSKEYDYLKNNNII